jgi:integrase
MKSTATQSNGSEPPIPTSSGPSHRRSAYQKVLDARKRPLRGLWIRNNRFYARLSVLDPNSGQKKVRRVPLEGIETVAQAQAELRRLLTHREDNDLPALKRTPKFGDYVREYFAFYEKVKDAKRPRTLATERGHLKGWVQHLGETRLNSITKAMINGFIAKRQSEGVSGRTVNLAVIVLRSVLKKGIDDGWITRLPMENLRPLKWTPKKRALVTLEQINQVREAAVKDTENGVEFSDYVGLMAFCGSRMTETLALKWSDVDWVNRQLTIGADGQTKNHKSRVVDFNPNLEALLKEMQARRAPDTQWLFPSPQRGDQDRAAKDFRATLIMARRAAGLETFGFHDCRHFFISMSVMSGIDYMTIARWVGHQDGGVLIGRVYGHLSNEHAQRQAQRLVFAPAVVETTMASG